MADEGTQGTEGTQEFTPEMVQALMQERDALRNKNQELLGEVKKERARVKAYEGIDPEAARAAAARLAELEQQSKAEKHGVTSEVLEKLRAEVEQNLDKKYSPYRTRAEELERENRALKLDNVVKAIYGKSGVRAERVDDLYRLTADQYDLTDDGKPVLKNAMGTPIDEFAKGDLRKAYPEWFEGSGSSGGGATKSIAGGGGSRVIAANDSAGFLANLDKIAKGEVQVR